MSSSLYTIANVTELIYQSI